MIIQNAKALKNVADTESKMQSERHSKQLDVTMCDGYILNVQTTSNNIAAYKLCLKLHHNICNSQLAYRLLKSPKYTESVFLSGSPKHHLREGSMSWCHVTQLMSKTQHSFTDTSQS